MDYYNEIKNELIDNEINKKVRDYSRNKYELEKYYNVGKLLIDAQGGEDRAKYGDSLIREYSIRLTNELGIGYNTTSLKRMRKIYLLIQKGATVSHLLSWSHYVELLPFDDINKFNYYVYITENENLGVRQLRERIKSKEYERLPEETKNKLLNRKENNIEDFIKNPIMIRNNNYEVISERILQKLIMENISSFLKELGSGFTFIDNEYKIKLGNRYNYIDLLLFNYIYDCFVVVELKIGELKKEHVGQIQIYMNYIDDNLRKINQNKTIGIIICRENNKYIIKYCSDKRIIAREYELV